MKLIFGICLSFLVYFSTGLSDKPVKEDAIIQVAPAKTKIESEASKYKSFKRFLDSICNMGKQSPVKRNIISANKIKTDTLHSSRGLRLVKNMGPVKQYYFSESRSTVKDPGTCYSFLGIGNIRFENDTIMCWQQFSYWPNRLLTYNNASFIIMKGEPDADNCVGGACRINFYPVIGMYKSDTSFHYFINTDDIAGIRYLDINHDGFLDFLSVQSGFTDKYMQQLTARNNKYRNLDCSENQCYKITAFSFKRGNWEITKDKNGNEYFMLIKLDNPLNQNSSFKLLMSNWL